MTKTCTKCNRNYPATIEYFVPNIHYTGGLTAWCRKCKKKQDKKYYQQHTEKIKMHQQKFRQTKKGKKYCKEYMKKYPQTLIGHLRIVFAGIIQRCNNQNRPAYKNYGGRGIKNKFTSDEFVDYVINTLGYNTYEKIKGLQIDRIDNDGHYEKGNIRFVTAKVNSNNKRKK